MCYHVCCGLFTFVFEIFTIIIVLIASCSHFILSHAILCAVCPSLHLPFTLPITHHTSPVPHPSSLIPHPPSPITHHPSPITHHPSPITHHPSPITHHPSPLS